MNGQMEQRTPFDEWAILELMGHRRLAGRVTEQEIGGSTMIRIDVFTTDPEQPAIATQFYSSGAIYCITPTSEEIARKMSHVWQPEPVSRYELPMLPHKSMADVEDEVGRPQF